MHIEDVAQQDTALAPCCTNFYSDSSGSGILETDLDIWGQDWILCVRACVPKYVFNSPGFLWTGGGGGVDSTEQAEEGKGIKSSKL